MISKNKYVILGKNRKTHILNVDFQFYLMMVYFATLSVAIITWRRTFGTFMKNGLKIM